MAIVEQAAREIDTAILHTIERDPLYKKPKPFINRCLRPFRKVLKRDPIRLWQINCLTVKKPLGGPYAFKQAVRD